MRNKLFNFIFVVSIAGSISYPCLAGESYHSSEASTENDSEASYGASSQSSNMPSTMSSQENAAEAAHQSSNESRFTMYSPPGSSIGTGSPAPEANMNIQARLGEDAKNVNIVTKEGTLVLTGTVKTSDEKARINGIASQIGIPVANEIKVENPDIQPGKVVTVEEPAPPKPTAVAKSPATSKPDAVSKPPEAKATVKVPAVH